MGSSEHPVAPPRPGFDCSQRLVQDSRFDRLRGKSAVLIATITTCSFLSRLAAEIGGDRWASWAPNGFRAQGLGDLVARLIGALTQSHETRGALHRKVLGPLPKQRGFRV